MLIGVTRNLLGLAEPRLGGRKVTPTSRELLDAQDPYWHDGSRTRFRKEVRNFTFDETNPLEYYVYPGNDGSGFLELVTADLPKDVVATGNVNDIASYAVDIDLPEPYSEPLHDYVMFRSLQKDDLAGSPTRAVGYYQTFAAALGIKVQVEGAHSPRRERS